jgi:hypothetical protein
MMGDGDGRGSDMRRLERAEVGERSGRDLLITDESGCPFRAREPFDMDLMVAILWICSLWLFL